MLSSQKSKKGGLARGLALALGSSVSTFALLGATPALAQSAGVAEEEVVVVTGIRASLRSAAAIKRDASGVVDAITAEDIGAFPDSNLAESIQRISGVSIDRSNNEGSRVTVRGFGPEFNLVILNDRQMPTSALQGDSTRAFDFANLASEAVSGVEVYKTSNALLPSGGIGSTINIRTARPLDRPGFNGAVSLEALHDTTNVRGDDYTPEFAAIVSNTFADDMFGVGLSYSYSRRDSRVEQAEVALWRENIAISPTAVGVDNRTDPSGNTWYPRNFGLGVENISRERTNGQLVLQFQPVSTFRATLDYTYSEFENEGYRQGVGIWFGDFPPTTRYEIDENGTYVFVEETCCDYSSNQRLNTSRNVNNSVGLNLDWQASDTLSFNFDYHNSDATSEGIGRGNDVFLILAANCIDRKSADFRTGNDIPDMAISWTGCLGAASPTGEPTAESYDSLFGQAGANVNEDEISQAQLRGRWDNAGEGGLRSIQFGVGHIDNTYHTRSFNSGQIAAGWYGGNQGVYDDAIFTRVPTDGLLDSFSGGGSNISPDFYYDWDFNAGVTAFETVFNGGNRLEVDKTATPITDHRINETTTSAYIQFDAETEFNAIPINLTAGLRYESTDITANSLQIEPEEIVWINPTEWSINRAADQTFTDVGAEYTLWLPSLDVSFEFLPDWVGRFSYSESVARPSLFAMQGTTSVTDRPKPGERTGNAGNPGLSPYTSDNIDLSLEWYYADGSYASIGVFNKQVDNFIVNQQTEQIVGNLRDPSAGPRYQQALADVVAGGGSADDIQAIMDQININAGLPVGTPIVQQNDDPLAVFRINAPSNLESAELHGVEFAIQHIFGDSGFGIQANATLVEGDIDVDVSRVGFQFVLPGLSNSYNLVGFYDKNGLQARIAYNWRDEFLSSTADNQPQFTEAFGQLDGRISYDLTEQLTIFAEGINITGESQRIYNRYRNQLWRANEFGARYAFGARYNF